MRLLSRRPEDAVTADIGEVEALSCRSSTLAATRRAFACLTALILLSGAAMAGPPYISDDPEPTDYRHYEIYLFSSGTNTESGTSGASGIDFNYGAARDVQLTAVLPLDYATANSGSDALGLGNIELAAKYRVLHQADIGWDVAVFPRVFLPSAANTVGERHAICGSAPRSCIKPQRPRAGATRPASASVCVTI